jgi:CPA2 family monovalent cation:H+ antiporter-2
VVLVITTVLLWRNLAGLQERLEGRVRQELAAEGDQSPEAHQWNIHATRPETDWKLNVREATVATNSQHAGRQLHELRLRNDWHCSIVGIDRQGYAISNPPGDERLFPGDRLLILGKDEDLARASAFLQQGAERPEWTQQFDELVTELVTVPPAASCVDNTLRDLDFANRFRIQVGGLRREGTEIVSPKAGERIQPGDQLLLIGTHANIARFREFVTRDLA